MKKMWSLIRNESGQVLPLVMIVLAVGSLLIVPSLNYVWTHVTAGVKLEEDVKALYAADAGIEDAIWHLKTTPPEDWQTQQWWDPDKGLNLSNFNGMNVHTTVGYVQYIGGEKVTRIGTHQDWVTFEHTSSYEAISETSGIYTFTQTIINYASPKNMNVSWLIIDFPAGMTYKEGSLECSENMSLEEPTPSDNLRLTWGEVGGKKLFTIDGNPKEPHIYTLTLQLEGPPLSGELKSNLCLYIQDEIKFFTESWPLVITAKASDTEGVVHATITAGISLRTTSNPAEIDVRSWQITR